MNAPPKTLLSDRAALVLAFLQLRRGRLLLALAENELAWLQQALVAGHIRLEVALEELDQVFDDLAGAAS